METLQTKSENAEVSSRNGPRKRLETWKQKKEELTKTIEKLQKEEAEGDNLEKIQQAELDLDKVLKLEEIRWYQRSRALWLKAGDRNTSYFHQKASHRKKRNTISKITLDDGKEITEEEEISEEFCKFYMDLFSKNAEASCDDILGAIESKVTPAMNEDLQRSYTEKDIIEAIKHMHLDKSPGPDGMTPLFFQKYWNIIRKDVLEAALNILNSGSDPSHLNNTYIVLIPKKKAPPKFIRL